MSEDRNDRTWPRGSNSKYVPTPWPFQESWSLDVLRRSLTSGDLCQAGACHGTLAVLHDSKAGCRRAAVVDVLHPPVHQLLVGASIHSLSSRVQRNPGSVAVHALQHQACRQLLRRPSAVLQEGRGGEGGLVQAVVASTVTAAQGGVERPCSGTLATPVALATLPADSASGLGEEVLLLEKAPAGSVQRLSSARETLPLFSQPSLTACTSAGALGC